METYNRSSSTPPSIRSVGAGKLPGGLDGIRLELLRAQQEFHSVLDTAAQSLADEDTQLLVPPRELLRLDPHQEVGLIRSWRRLDSSPGQPSEAYELALDWDLFSHEAQRYAELVLEAPYSILQVEACRRGVGVMARDLLVRDGPKLVCDPLLAEQAAVGDFFLARYITSEGITLLEVRSRRFVAADRKPHLEAGLRVRLRSSFPLARHRLMTSASRVWASMAREVERSSSASNRRTPSPILGAPRGMPPRRRYKKSA